MKFVHMADMHFGDKFSRLEGRNKFVQKRKLFQRESFDKIIDFINTNSVEHFFIAGDLFEHEEVQPSIIEYCNKKFSEIPNTYIWISPGNHDPYIKNSYYQTTNWSKNVTIFKNKIECYESDNIDIYGFGFSGFYEKSSGVENIVLKNKDKLNILVTHGDLDASINSDKPFNPISNKKLQEVGFDYVALGHIHKPQFSKESRIIYPGSTIAMSFGNGFYPHGFVAGEITKESYNIEFITLDEGFYKEIPIDVSNVTDKDELINELNRLNLDMNSVYQIKLIGKRDFYIDTAEILKYITKDNILSIKNEANENYDFEQLAQENNLKGFFVREMIEKLSTCQENEYEEIKRALEIGLEFLN